LAIIRIIILCFEWILLIFMGLAFWYPIEIRARWMGLLLEIPVVLGLRWGLQRRLWTWTPLDAGALLLLGLAAVSLVVAPYTFLGAPNQWMVLGRLVFGLALMMTLVESVRMQGRMEGMLIGTLGLGGILAVATLTGSLWTTKSVSLEWLIQLLPRWTGFPGAEGGFNVNEAGGALAWWVPVMLGGALGVRSRGLRWGLAVVFGLLLLALFLGQSRAALLGVILALLGMVVVLLRGWRRMLGVVLLGLFAGWNVLIFTSANTGVAEASFTRDESSLAGRISIYQSAWSILVAEPLTGTGVNTFRIGPVREQYPAALYGSSILPHAHNELLQVGADMGAPGWIVWLSVHGMAGLVLWRVFRGSDGMMKALAMGVGGGLLAHGVYGMLDAVTLWDRFGFLWWWLLGLVGGLWWHTRTQARIQH
jgi:O-antigen ligase